MNPLEHSAKTPSETVAILRHLDGWPVQSHSRKKVQEAIDAAIEMIDRLEAAEAECLEQALLNGMGSEREAALMAKLEAAEKELAELRSSMKFRTSLIGRITRATKWHRVD